jgi:hypothetical protein
MTADEEDIPDSDQLQDHNSSEETSQLPTIPTEQEQLMQISLHAIHGKNSISAFTVKVHIGGRVGTALVDSGSSHTFIDLKFATKTSCITALNPMEIVKVAGGGELQSGSHIPETQYQIQGHKFSNLFKILPLKGYDLVLGCDWLYTHSPYTMDLKQRTLKLLSTTEGEILLRDASFQQGVESISVNMLHKGKTVGAVGYYLFPINQLSSNSQDQQNSHDIDELLIEFKDVFEEPTTLPPVRNCDHAIPLKQGSEPTVVRPYRVPHK